MAIPLHHVRFRGQSEHRITFDNIPLSSPVFLRISEQTFMVSYGEVDFFVAECRALAETTLSLRGRSHENPQVGPLIKLRASG